MFYPIFLILGGTLFAVFGGRILFENGYVERLLETDWESKSGPSTSDYNYSKFMRGGAYLTVGLMLFTAGLLDFVEVWDLHKLIYSMFS